MRTRSRCTEAAFCPLPAAVTIPIGSRVEAVGLYSPEEPTEILAAAPGEYPPSFDG